MEITFINQNTDNNIQEIARDYFKGRINDFKFYMENGWNDYDDENHNEDLPPLNEYGLCFDANHIEECKQCGSKDIDDWGGNEVCCCRCGEPQSRVDYYCYQLSYGGPSDEIRFYKDKIEYVYLDWFCGIGFDISNEDWAQWLKSDFSEFDILKF